MGLFAGRRVAVLGLAKSGRTAAEALTSGGADVVAWDDNAKVREALAGKLRIENLAEADWSGIAALVLSPGIPHSFPQPHPAVLGARAAGVEIVGDLELLYRAQPAACYLGITGTNGKSTTTALIGHILHQAGRTAEVGGNLGTPALALAPLGRDSAYVLEASSYQLELLSTLTFDIAVLLNITPDHLDRHGGMEGYIGAKRHIFDRQGSAASAVIGIDDSICRAIAEEVGRAGRQRVVPISVREPVSGGVYVEVGVLFDALEGAPQRVLDLADAERLPGSHNWQNAAAGYAVARRYGIAPDVAAAAIRSF
ncbi:MAG TPA: Mur ligase family protein, partial [Stellaceae bacterium]|nr:Mur ligase family protein [Stellaceae bacterium]